MKSIRWIARSGLAFAMLLSLSPASAQNPFKAGNWTGSVTFSSGAFTHCTISVGYTDNATLYLLLTAQMNLTIYATRTDFNVDPAQSYNVVIEIDPSFRKTYRATGRTGQRNAVSFNLGNDSDFRQTLAAGKTMTWVDSEGKRYPFDLTNIANALRKLITCAALYGVE